MQLMQLHGILSKREVDLNTRPNGLIDEDLCKESAVSMQIYSYVTF